jgi:nicotinate phosphoribosyltransferase
MDEILLHHPSDHAKYRTLRGDEISEVEPLLVNIAREGRLLVEHPPVETMRQNRLADVARLDPGVRRLVTPHVYHVSLTGRLWDLKQDLIRQARA